MVTCKDRKKSKKQKQKRKQEKCGVWTSLGVLVLFYYLGMHTQVLADWDIVIYELNALCQQEI